MSVDRPLSRPLVVVKNAAQPLLYPLARPLVRSALYSTSALTRFAVNGVEAALALDFIGGEYRTGNAATTFADAFMGNSPKLTYNPGSASTSQSTMVNSSGELVWAPHNLEPDSNDITNYNVLSGASIIDSETFTTSGTNGSALTGRSIPADLNATYTVRAQIWSETDAGTAARFGVRTIGIPDETKSITLQSTPTWEDLESDLTGATQFRGILVGSNSAATIKIRNISVYRSDLGGMAQVPGADTGFEYYVPTNGSAEYLPRVGHHVYNGSAWVNEGLLIESEPRTNLVAHSVPDNTNWTVTGLTLDDTTGYLAPDGTQGAVKLTSSASGTNRIRFSTSLSGVNSYSFYAKGGTGSYVQILDGSSGNYYANFDLSLGSEGTKGNLVTSLIEDVGSGWYRCTMVTDGSVAGVHFNVYIVDSASAYYGAPSTSADTVYIWGFQLEAGSTPSSYIPTSGSTVIRGGQSLTVPAHWYDVDNPTPTGPELVTDFSTYASEAEFFADGFIRSDATKITFDATNDTLDIADASNVRIDGHIPFVEGATYEVSITNDGPGNFSFQDNFSSFQQSVPVGTSTFVFTKSSGDNVRVVIGAGNTASISNISVRQVSAPQFGWPEPEFIGSELVTNGGFDTDTDWTKGTGWTISGGVAVATSVTGAQSIYQPITRTAGSIYAVSVEVSGSSGSFSLNINGSGTGDILTGDGTHTVYAVANSSNSIDFQIQQRTGVALSGTFDNVSVREINPLSVSLQMDGRMTYADEDTGASATFVTAGSFVTGTTYVIETVGTTNFTAIGAEANTVGTVFTATGAGSGDGTALPMTAQLAKWGGVGMALDTHDAATGGFVFTTDDGNTEYVETSDTALTPGVNVPFNISSRHGSTFVNGAVDGTALTANTTPTALPDLSATNLQIAPDFMGTIGTFRQFAGDIGDAGLVTATNPSTEPTLSLTFDGTNGSFYNQTWSE